MCVHVNKSGSEDEKPYGLFYEIGDVRAYVDMRRSKKTWKNVNKNGGKRIKYFPQRKKRQDN